MLSLVPDRYLGRDEEHITYLKSMSKQNSHELTTTGSSYENTLVFERDIHDRIADSVRTDNDHNTRDEYATKYAVLNLTCRGRVLPENIQVDRVTMCTLNERRRELHATRC